MKLKVKPFALIGVNITGYGVKQLKQTMEKQNLPWRSFADTGAIGQGQIATKWNLSTTPTFYLIDAQGVIRNKWAGAPGPKVLDAALDKLIAETEK
jgi:peroxiredoxin